MNQPPPPPSQENTNSSNGGQYLVGSVGVNTLPNLITTWYRPEPLRASTFADAAWLAFFSTKIDCRSYSTSLSQSGLEVRLTVTETKDAWDALIAFLLLLPALESDNARPDTFGATLHGQSIELGAQTAAAVESMLFYLQVVTHGSCRVDLNLVIGDLYEFVDLDASVSGLRSITDVCPTSSDFQSQLHALKMMVATPEYGADGLIHSYRYNYSKSRLQFVGDTHTYQVVSSTDGFCGFHALSFLLKTNPSAGVDDVVLEDVYNFFVASSPDGSSTPVHLTIAAARAFSIPVMHVDTFYQKFATSNIKSLASSSGYQVSPAILYDAGHVYIAFSPRDQYRKIGDLTRLMQAVAGANPSDPINNQVVVEKRVKASKPKKANVATPGHKGIAPLPKDLVVPIHEKGCPCSKAMALYVAMHRLGVTLKKPKVACAASAILYASLRKAAHPTYFEKVEREDPLILTDDYRPATRFVSGRFKVVSGEMRGVDPKALRELGPNLVFSLTADSTPMDVLQAPLSHKPHFSVEFDRMRPRFVANLRGQTLPRSALQVAASWAIPISNLENKERGRNGSAHSFCRFMADYCQSLALNRLPCFQSDAQGAYTLIDVGAKFASLIPVLARALQPVFSKVFPPFSFPQDLTDDQRAYVRARSLVQSTLQSDPTASVEDFFELLQNELAVANCPVDRYQNLTDYFLLCVGELVRLMSVNIRYVAIRPDDTPADATYWRENHAVVSTNPRLEVELYRGTLQQYAGLNQVPEGNVTLLFFDSHYYFSPLVLSALPVGYQNVPALVTGLNFPTVDGHYTLPLGEGSCVVRNGGSMVDMNTRGGLEVYSHANHFYSQPIHSFNSGWVSWFCDSTVVATMASRLMPIHGPPSSPGHSIQDVWMTNYALSLKGSGDKVFHSLEDVKRRFARPFSPPSVFDGAIEELAFWCSRSFLRSNDPEIFELLLPESGHSVRLLKPMAFLSLFLCFVCPGLYTFLMFLAFALTTYFASGDVRRRSRWSEVHVLLEDPNEEKELPEKWSDLLSPAARSLHYVAGKNTYGYQDSHVFEKPARQKVSLPKEASRAELRGGYYRYKKPTAPLPMNPVLSASENNDPNLQAFYRCAESAPFTTLKRVGTRIEVQELTEESNFAVQSGHSVVSTGRYGPSDGSQNHLQEFEWSHKALCNSYMGFLRYANTQAQATDLAGLRKTATAFWDRFFAKWQAPEVRSFFDYPASAFPDQPGKAQKYLDLLKSALSSGDLSRGPFVTMVKSGEVYFGPPAAPGMCFTTDDSRPRNIMTPQGVGYSVSAAVQWMLWASIKQVLPGFIQGMTSAELTERFETLSEGRPEKISFDGSAFESTQYASHRDMAEGEFLRRIRPWLIDVFSHPENVVQGLTPVEAADRFIKLNTDFHVDIFVPCPGSGAQWSPQQLRTFYKYIKGSHRDYIPFRMNGTMASGDPFTTLGNTFRNLIYIDHYIGQVDARGAAAGDDGTIFCPSGTGHTIVLRMRSLTSRDKSTPSPTGQVLPDIVCSTDWQKLEFCSKWFYHVGGRLSCSRDLVKLLTTKQWYSRKNAHLLSNPALHRLAILEGVRYEKASHLLEDILLASSPKMTPSQEEAVLISRSGVNKYAPLPTNYELERQVNSRLGLSILDLCQVLTRGWFVAGSIQNTKPLMEEEKKAPKAAKRQQKKNADLPSMREKVERRQKKDLELQRVRPTAQPLLPEVISDWERMLIAKHFPGRYNVPYVTDMNVTTQKTGCLDSAFNVAQCADTANYGNLYPFGSYWYVVVAFCPVLSGYYGPGNAGTLSSSVKLGGLSIQGTNSPTAGILSFSDFFTTSGGCFDMSTIYGSQGSSIAENVLIWAAQLDMLLEGPSACRAGVAKVGHFNLSSLYDRNGVVGTALSVNDLMKSVTHIYDLKATDKVSLSSAIVNHSLANNLQVQVDSTYLGSTTENQALGSEFVTFAIIENAFQNLTTGATLNFVMSNSVRANFVYAPKVYDAFTQRLNFDTRAVPGVPGHYVAGGPKRKPILITADQQRQAASLTKYTPNAFVQQRPSGLMDALRRLRDFYEKNKALIDPVMALTAHLARSLRATKPLEAQTEPVLSVQNEIASLKEIQSLLARSPISSRYNLTQVEADLQFLYGWNKPYVLPSDYPSLPLDVSIELPEMEKKALPSIKKVR